MTRPVVTPPPPPDPSNRWPWLALIGGLVIILLAAGLFFRNFLAPQQTVAITTNGAPTATPVRPGAALTATAQAGPPPTFTPLPTPTSFATPSPIPSPTPFYTPTPLPLPTLPPTPVVVVIPPTAPPQAAGAPPATQPVGQPTTVLPPTPGGAGQPAAPTPTSAPVTQPATAAPPAATPSPTPFSGQVSASGGIGNTQPDFTAAYGAPTGETPGHLVVYKQPGNVEYHVLFTPAPARAQLVAKVLPPNANPPLSLDQALQQVKPLLPRDAQQTDSTPEGNNQYALERFTSQTLAQVLPASAFSPGGGQPGQLLAVFVKDAQGNITRIIVGPGNDAVALINQSNQ